MENQMKLLITAFMVILLGVVLIQPIGDDIEIAKTSSITITNESVSLAVTTEDIVNETVTLAGNVTGTLANNHVTALTALWNLSGTDLLPECNITLSTGGLVCNDTNSEGGLINASYTFKDYSTGKLTYDEGLSFDACRNSSMTAILASTHCNVTLETGAVKVTYDNFTDNLAFIDYKYEPDTYVHSGTARTLITLVILFFALAVLAIGVGYVVKSFKDSGMM